MVTKNLAVVVLLLSLALSIATQKTKKPAQNTPTSTFVKQNKAYPKEVFDIFKEMPEYEFYEPPKGRKFGFIDNLALFPNEIKSELKVYFRKSNPPPSGYPEYKYVVLCYFYSKNMNAKTKQGNPVYVAHYVLVPNKFNDPIKNYMELTVYNPIAKMEVPITIERTFKKPVKIIPLVEKIGNKNPTKASVPKVKDPMLKKAKFKPETKKDKKVKKSKNMKPVEAKKNKNKFPINPKTGKPYTKDELEAKIKEEVAKKKRIHDEKVFILKKKRQEKNKEKFMKHVDYSLIFPAPAKPVPLKVVRSPAEERSLGAGGLATQGSSLGVGYFKHDSMLMKNMRQSTFYPPFNMEYPTIPEDCEVNIDDIGLGLIAKYYPPAPLTRGMKYTYFFLCPARFRYPGDRRVYIPVYTLIPVDEKARPSDMREMVFDHFITNTDSVPKDQIMIDPQSKIQHTFLTTKPKQISQPSFDLITNKFSFLSPMKPMTKKFFLEKAGFKAFLKKHDLINPPDDYYQRHKTSRYNFDQSFSGKKIGNYLNGLFHFHDGAKDKLIQDAIARAKAENSLQRDREIEKRIREKSRLKDKKIQRELKEELKLKSKSNLLNHELNAMKDILRHLNPKSPLLKNVEKAKKGAMSPEEAKAQLKKVKAATKKAQIEQKKLKKQLAEQKKEEDAAKKKAKAKKAEEKKKFKKATQKDHKKK